MDEGPLPNGLRLPALPLGSALEGRVGSVSNRPGPTSFRGGPPSNALPSSSAGRRSRECAQGKGLHFGAGRVAKILLLSKKKKQKQNEMFCSSDFSASVCTSFYSKALHDWVQNPLYKGTKVGIEGY